VTAYLKSQKGMTVGSMPLTPAALAEFCGLIEVGRLYVMGLTVCS